MGLDQVYVETPRAVSGNGDAHLKCGSLGSPPADATMASGAGRGSVAQEELGVKAIIAQQRSRKRGCWR